MHRISLSSTGLQWRTPLAFLYCCVSLLPFALGQDLPEPNEPKIVESSGEAELALKGFRLAKGIEGNLFAAEPLFANPVALFVDDRGRVFVCETFRQGIAVVDNRNFPDEWVDADLASNSVEDRRKYHLEQLGDRVKEFMEEDDQIRLLIDSDGNGVADESHVFAKNFNGLVDGTGAGVLEYKGNIYYTCIPSLYLMRDEDGDNQADGKTTLHTGFGARVAFRGHDMHGLVIGPDGRLYFSIGDRGANVDTPNGKLLNVESGSVFRCELDGSNLELYATGLRNPQELAFDNFGNLFTGDNNSDSGDQARWVYVVEDGDTGWRMAYQYLPDRGPFNREKIWEPLHEEQPAYIVPPIANFADGPSGLDFYPGTGFGDMFRDQFFLADFRGTTNQSGIRSIRNESDGAFFKIAEDQQPIWEILATDFQFGPDGAIYICDWVNGWEGEGKGRIYRFISTDHHSDAIVAEVKQLLASNISEVEVAQLAEYLGHADRRIRQKAQLELATRGELDALLAAARSGKSLMERLHGMWGLDHLGRTKLELQDDVRSCFLSLAGEEEVELRAHAIRLLGEFGGEGAVEAARTALGDSSARVRYFALKSLRKLEDTGSFERVVAEIAGNAGRDPIIRHGGIMALTAVATPEELTNLKSHPAMQVRRAAVVALRRLESPAIAEYLTDAHPLVVAEAARAIHDVPIIDAYPALAELISTPSEDEELLRRVLNANLRLGQPENAAKLAQFAASETSPLAMRLEAISMLGSWETPRNRDRVLGMWRPFEARDPQTAADALAPVIAGFANAASELRVAVGSVGSRLKIATAAPVLKALVIDQKMEPEQRAEALVALVDLGDPDLESIVNSALKDSDVAVRAAALSIAGTVMPEQAASLLAKAALGGETKERQTAIAALGKMPDASEGLMNVLSMWAAGDLPPEVQLEALTAAEAHKSSAEVADILQRVNAKRDSSIPLEVYRETLFGGDARKGQTVFREKVSVSCVRCHKVGFDGGEVGPELTRIAVDKTREYLLESIVDPNKAIAKGFESAILLDADGQVHTGVVRNETDAEITLIDAEGKITTFDKEEIESRAPSKSAMPDDLVKNLTKDELRDLVEYLSSLNGRNRFRRPAEVL